MCQPSNKERIRLAAAFSEERQLILAACQSLLDQPSGFFGVSILGIQKYPSVPACMQTAQIKRANARSDARVFEEFFSSYLIIAIKMRDPGTLPCLEFLMSVAAYSDAEVLLVCEDGFERWDLYELVQAKLQIVLRKRREENLAASG